MKNLFKHKFSIIIPCLILLAGSTMAQKVSFEKTINKSFEVQPNITVEVSNKQGKINIIPWAKNTVAIEIVMELKAKNDEKLDLLREGIDFDFTTTKNLVSAKTVFNQSWKSLIALGNEINIDYVIHLPQQASIRLTNKFGDIYVGSLRGDASIELSHGDLKAEHFVNNADISLKYGKGFITSIGKGILTLSYADITIAEIGVANFDTKSSTININSVKELAISSNRDNFHVSEAINIQGHSTFTDLDVDKLDNALNLTTKYGAVNIKSISNNFKLIDVTCKYTDVWFNFNSDAAYNFDMNHKNVNFSYPKHKATLNNVSQDDKEKEWQTTGTIGTTNPDGKTVRLVAESCDLKIIQ